ncbi:hypothetical protein [Novosphingobium album (ex Liu et al. 2023)]|uniref:hypothetical protein n=1 Tax=Novosphingobium album (ex Liu et al. 2023) TaxID=3031130 RepID=UPI0023AF1262|nr:hypothetical protein [Novosphingobium album (ex Liu et al. 2023)]
MLDVDHKHQGLVGTLRNLAAAYAKAWGIRALVAAPKLSPCGPQGSARHLHWHS